MKEAKDLIELRVEGALFGREVTKMWLHGRRTSGDRS